MDFGRDENQKNDIGDFDFGDNILENIFDITEENKEVQFQKMIISLKQIEESYRSKRDAVIFVIDTSKDILENTKEDNDTVVFFHLFLNFETQLEIVT